MYILITGLYFFCFVFFFLREINQRKPKNIVYLFNIIYYILAFASLWQYTSNKRKVTVCRTIYYKSFKHH